MAGGACRRWLRLIVPEETKRGRCKPRDKNLGLLVFLGSLRTVSIAAPLTHVAATLTSISMLLFLYRSGPLVGRRDWRPIRVITANPKAASLPAVRGNQRDQKASCSVLAAVSNRAKLAL